MVRRGQLVRRSFDLIEVNVLVEVFPHGVLGLALVWLLSHLYPNSHAVDTGHYGRENVFD